MSKQASTPPPGDKPNGKTDTHAAGRAEAEPAPGNRPRGRPRKESRNGGSPSTAGEDQRDPEKDGEGQQQIKELMDKAAIFEGHS